MDHFRFLAIAAIAWTFLAAPYRPAQVLAEVLPTKPYGQIVDQVMTFLISDVGNGGIRTNDNDPGGYPVPPYFYHFAIYDDNDLWSSTGGYPFHSAISYPGYTASLAIGTFLDYYRYSGNPEAVARACLFADWIIEHRTPAGDLYGNLPYSTQTEGEMGGAWDGDAIMTDKPAMFGVSLLRLFDTTGDSLYWYSAEEIAATLAATQLTGAPEDNGRWPFRVRPCDGLVRQDYTSHLQPALRFFDAMAARTGDPLHATVRDRTWQWLLDNPCNPASPSYLHWEAFYEDQDPAQQTGKRDHYSAHEMIVELVRRQPAGWEQTATDILDWAVSLFIMDHPDPIMGDYVPVMREWEGWMEPTFAATLQFASTALFLFQALEGHVLQDSLYHHWARDMAAVCSHGQNQRGIAADGRMYTTVRDIFSNFTDKSWYEQDFNTVKYVLELMALDPSLAPSDENHLLWSDQLVQWIEYASGDTAVSYEIVSGAGREVLRLIGKPSEVLAAGVPLPTLTAAEDPGPGWHWDHATGVLTVSHDSDPVVVFVTPAGIGGGLRPGGATPHLRVISEAGTDLPVVELQLAEPGRITARVYDLRGWMVRTLCSGLQLSAGVTLLSWDGRDDRGLHAAGGVYFLKVSRGDQVASVRLVLLR